MAKFSNKKQHGFILYWWITTIGSVIFLALTIYFDRVGLLTHYIAPSGADPGNWLTAAWEIGGSQIRLTQWAYPPLIFILLRILLYIFAPMEALKITGMVAWLLIGTNFLLVVRIIYPRQKFYIQLGIASLVVLAGYQGEIYAWGGYPQLLGMSFLLIVFPALDQWRRNRNFNWLVISILSAEMVIYTHHLLAGVLAFYIVMLTLLILLNPESSVTSEMKGFFTFLIPTLILALPAVTVYWRFVEYLGDIPTNPQQFGFGSAGLLFDYVFQNQSIIWLPLLLFSLVFAVWNRKNAFSNTVILFIGGSLILLFISWEVRLSHLLIIGVGFGLILIDEVLASNLRTRPLSAVYGIGIAILLMFILPVAKDWFITSSSFYQVVDADTFSALTWVKENTKPGEIVAASPWSTNLIGWWIEGYSQRPCIYATDLRWLVFAKEREYAKIANDLFAADTSGQQMVQIVNFYRISYLFIDKKAIPSSVGKYMSTGLFEIAFENQRVLILRVDRTNLSYAQPQLLKGDLEHIKAQCLLMIQPLRADYRLQC